MFSLHLCVDGGVLKPDANPRRPAWPMLQPLAKHSPVLRCQQQRWAAGSPSFDEGAQQVLGIVREMKDAGSYNFVQDKASCVVFGIPREAMANGAAEEVLPLKAIAPALVARLRGGADRVLHRI